MARIVIVEDDSEVRCALKEILEGARHEVREARNGEIGLAMCQQERPDVVVLDILMPEKDGLETTLELVKTLPETKIIAISGARMEGGLDVLDMAKKFGAHCTLVKPIEAKELIHTLRHVLNEI